MLENSWFFQLILLIHVMSVLLYFIDFLQHNRKVNRLAFWLLSIVWSLQTVYMLAQFAAVRSVPIDSQFDSLFFYAWILISLSLLINWIFRMDFLLFFTNVIGFTVVSLSLFVRGREFSEVIAEQLASEWVLIHVTMAMFSYAAFTLSFVLSSLYLLEHIFLKRKKWGPRFKRWPGLLKLDLYAFRLNLIGLPLLFLSLILGVIWAYYTLEFFVLWDGKVIFSALLILVYALYFFQRVHQGWSGKKSAQLNIICFTVLMVNVLFSTPFSDFHL